MNGIYDGKVNFQILMMMKVYVYILYLRYFRYYYFFGKNVFNVIFLELGKRLMVYRNKVKLEIIYIQWYMYRQ